MISYLDNRRPPSAGHCLSRVRKNRLSSTGGLLQAVNLLDRNDGNEISNMPSSEKLSRNRHKDTQIRTRNSIRLFGEQSKFGHHQQCSHGVTDTQLFLNKRSDRERSIYYQ